MALWTPAHYSSAASPRPPSLSESLAERRPRASQVAADHISALRRCRLRCNTTRYRKSDSTGAAARLRESKPERSNTGRATDGIGGSLHGGNHPDDSTYPGLFLHVASKLPLPQTAARWRWPSSIGLL